MPNAVRLDDSGVLRIPTSSFRNVTLHRKSQLMGIVDALGQSGSRPIWICTTGAKWKDRFWYVESWSRSWSWLCLPVACSRLGGGRYDDGCRHGPLLLTQSPFLFAKASPSFSSLPLRVTKHVRVFPVDRTCSQNRRPNTDTVPVITTFRRLSPPLNKSDGVCLPDHLSERADQLFPNIPFANVLVCLD